MHKKLKRLRRARKTRNQIRRLNVPRLCVYRSLQHIYAQIIMPGTHQVLTAASSSEKSFKEKNKKTGNIEAATEIGKLIAERAKKVKIKKVAFDRSGFKFHGRIKALVEAARKEGLEF